MARIFKRNRTWWIDCGIVGGRRKRHSLETTSKRRAQEALAAYERRRALGEEEELKEATFTEFVDVYLELKAGRKAPRSRERDGHALKHLKPTFGAELLRDITQEEIEAWVARRSQETHKNGKTMAPGTVNKELNLLKAILRTAVDYGYLRKNPATPVSRLKIPEREYRFLEPDEAQRLIDAGEGQMRTFILTALSTGFRKEELFTLTWDDVVFDRRQIKTVGKGSRFRPIPLVDQLYDALKKHPRHVSSPYVFHNGDGSRWHDVRTRYRSTLRRAKLPTNIRFHDLKHTYVSNLVIAGVDLREVMELAGHRDIRTTMRYTHLAPGRDVAAISKLPWARGPGRAEGGEG